ncbi:hypothetical protein HN51_007997 [Arachis hypogaea]
MEACLYPPCYKDISFWINESFTENKLCELVRGIAGGSCIRAFFVPVVSSSLLVYYYFPDSVAVVFPVAFAVGPGHFYKTISLLPLPKRVVFLFSEASGGGGLHA